MATLRLRIDDEICQGHGRCYSLAPDLCEPDDLGAGRVIGDGVVTAELADQAQRAVDNCPECAVSLIEESS